MKTALGRRWLSLLLTLAMSLALAPAVFADGITSITLNKTELTLEVGESEKLSVTEVFGTDVGVIDWKTSDDTKATVASDGTVSAIGAGTATITATFVPAAPDPDAPDVKAECKVTVNNPPPPPIMPTSLTAALEPTSLNLIVGTGGSNLRATVTAQPADADLSGLSYNWSSSNSNIVINGSGASVTITASGAVTSATVTLTVSKGGVSSQPVTCTVSAAEEMRGLTLTPSGPIILDAGRQSVITAAPNPDIPDMKVEWTSDNEAVATAAAQSGNGRTGVISGRSPGEALVTASIGQPGNLQSRTLAVEVSGITLETPPTRVAENETVLLPGVNRYGAASGNLSWQSSNPSVAAISGSSVAGRGPGTAVITAYVGTYEASFTISVSNDPLTTIDAGDLRSNQTLRFSDLISQLRAQIPSDNGLSSLSRLTGVRVSADQGTLYYKYNSPDEPGEGVAQSAVYYDSPGPGQKDLRDITFVPNSRFGGGQVVINYNAVSTTNQNYSCRIVVNVVANNTSDISVSATNTSPARFSADAFNQVCQQEAGGNLDYVIFSLPPERQGTLYTDYVSTDNYGSKVSAGTMYRRSALDNIYFVPAAGVPSNGSSETITVYYTGRAVGTSGRTYSGRVNITVTRRSTAGGGGPVYNIPKGGVQTLDDRDFNGYCRDTLGLQTLRYIRFEALPSSSQGALYYNYRTASNPGTQVQIGTSYYYNSNPYIDRITFVPAQDYTGTVYIPFVGWDEGGNRFTGTLEINVRGSGGSGDIRYTCAPGRTVNFENSDFTNLCRALTDRTLNYIIFQDLPDRYTQGSLYHNSNTRVNTGTRYYNGSSSNRISRLSFQAAGGFSGSVDIPFIGYATNGETFNGVLTIDSVGSGSWSNTIRYSTDYNSAAVFERDDFDDISQWESGRNVSSVRFEIPSSSQGNLYRNYYSKSSPGTRITSSGTSISASALDRVAFVPASGFTGTVYIDFTVTPISGGTFTGTVEITVDRPGADVTARYSTRVSPVKFRWEDFRRSNYSLTSVQFAAMPSSSEGYLYYQYTSPTQYNRQASTGTVYRTSGSNLISDLTFVPRAGYTGTVTLPYTGTNSNGSTFAGEVVITVSPTYSSAYFTDMSGYSSQAQAAVDYLHEIGIITGISEGNATMMYAPERTITRGDFALLVYRAFGFSPNNSGPRFPDVPSNAYYSTAIHTLRAMGIVSGTDSGGFAPQQPLRRQDAILLVQRAMRSVGWSANDGPSSYLNLYSDGGQVSEYARGAMANAAQMGYLPLINGRLAPTANITRVDMAQVIHRILTY